MSTYWLRQKLDSDSDATTDNGDPVLTIHLEGGQDARVYCPDPDEYRVTADVVEKVGELGATIIAYGSWCETTVEGKLHGKAKGISVIPYAGLFAMLRRRGVSFAK